MSEKLKEFQPFLECGDFSDIYLEESSNLQLKWEEGGIESVVSSENSGAGLRILRDRETRFGHMSLVNPLGGLSSREEKEQFEVLRKNLSVGLSEKKPKTFQIPVMKTHSISKPPSQFSIEDKVGLLSRAFSAANSGPHIRQVNINYGEKLKKVGYLNSEGESYLEEKIHTVFSVTVTVERNGDLQTAYESIGGIVGFELFDGQVLETLGKMVSDRAHNKLYAPKAPVGEMPVVICSSAGGTLIHEAIGHSLEADAVWEGTSPAYVGKLGQVVGTEKLNVYDDPTVPGKRGSFHFDDEGVPSERTLLIEKGVLKNYLFDRLSAKRAGRASNGHGRRESYEHKPIPRMSNTFVGPGSDDPKEIVKNFKNGLLVTKMGGGQVNPANGDFVFEVEEGFHVQQGEKTLVRGVTLLGNGPEVLFNMDQIGSDHGWAIGTCGKEGQGVPVSDALPTVHIKKMIVGGQ